MAEFRFDPVGELETEKTTAHQPYEKGAVDEAPPFLISE